MQNHNSSSHLSNLHIHIWLPGLFNFKGGIQTYLRFFLAEFEKILSLMHEKSNQTVDLKIFIKNDYSANSYLFKDFSSVYFFGNKNVNIRTIIFTSNVISQALSDPPNLIIVGHNNFSPLARLLNLFLKIPYVTITYGVDVWDLKSPLLIHSLKASAKVITISNFTKQQLLQLHNISNDKIGILPCTFDFNLFAIAPKPEHLLIKHKLDHQQPVILTVCRLINDEQYKGYIQILKSLPLILKSIPNVHYLIIGKGDDTPRIEHMIQQLELQDYVTLVGFVPDEQLCDYYNLCDVFAMPSKREGFGIVYLEALACGKPVLAGNKDGATDALLQGELGVLVDPDDISEIAAELIRILNKTHPNPLLYQPLKLRERVMYTYGFTRFSDIMQELMQDILPPFLQ
uniref:Glycosyl transferase group 1 n=1 Tax=Cyanothece sp. (strain PCC 7425 / ATCC 29141) TaxID=395961 RepID=B8HND0_CYAP4